MSDKTQKIITSIKDVLSDKPLSISEISEKADINWRTAKHYLKILEKLGLVEEKSIKNTRTFFYKNKDNYFNLPIKEKHSKLISSIYANIKKTCLKLFDKEPTKTQAYKIIWRVDKELNLGLPIGWYRYGPCCVQIYKGNEEDTKLDKNIISIIEKTTKEYCFLDNMSLQKKIYTQEENKLYLTKQGLIELENNFENKEELNMLLMDLIKYAPDETTETVTDFARATLLLGWEKTRICFIDYVWKYITMVVFKKSLKFYYGDSEVYWDDKIESAKKESQIIITDLVKSKLNKLR